MVERPAILVTPLESTVEPSHIQELAAAIYSANPGQVISSAFPIQMYHFIDGLWIESGDLSSVLVKAGDEQPKPGELGTVIMTGDL